MADQPSNLVPISTPTKPKRTRKPKSTTQHQPVVGFTSDGVAKFEVGPLKFWALGDRVIIEEDLFRSGYECSKCEGRCKVKCPDCEGKGKRTTTVTTFVTEEGKPEQVSVEKKCSSCEEGYITCPQCSGKGGILVTPETSQRRPTSGVVVSAGLSCKTLKVGDSVLFSNFAGYVVDLDRAGSPVTLRILHETEILAGMDGHLTLTNLRGKSEIAAFTS